MVNTIIGNDFDESCLLFMSRNQWYSQTQYSYLSISFCPIPSCSLSLKWQSRSYLQSGVLLGAPPASLTNIRPRRKSLPETNALAYFVPASATNEKRVFNFVNQAVIYFDNEPDPPSSGAASSRLTSSNSLSTSMQGPNRGPLSPTAPPRRQFMSKAAVTHRWKSRAYPSGPPEQGIKVEVSLCGMNDGISASC